MEGELIAIIAVAGLAVTAIAVLAWALGGWRRADVHGRELLLTEREADLQASRYEVALQRDRVELLHRAADLLTAEQDRDHLAITALELLFDVLHADAGTLHFVGDPEAPAAATAARGLPVGVLPSVRFGQGHAGRAWRDTRTTVGEHEAQRTVDGPKGKVDVRYEAALPIVYGHRTLAIAWLLCGDERGFATGQLQTAERIAAQIGLALAHSELREESGDLGRISGAMLNATPDALALLSPAGDVIAENDAMRELRAAGITPVGPDDAGADGELRDELSTPGGNGVLLRFSAPVRDEAGALLGRAVVLRDITGERESERLKDEFFALVSHELRTPLTSIIGYLDLVLDDGDGLDADTQRFLEVVQRNARRLLRLVGDLLFVAQVEAGQLSLEQTQVDLGQIAAEAVEAARPRAEGNGVSLVLSAEPARPLTGDRDRFGQMLDNLIGNAVKFSPDGGHVEITLADQGGDAVLEVRDTGMGIPPEDLDRLFERFFRSSDATRRAVPGVGLGLTIVKAIVDAHEGTIDVTSDARAGTTFRIVLPYRSRPELDLDAEVAAVEVGRAR
ncbi:MAG: GAF domain-containing protein [Solirubrobacteraceae bacterium]|nr:GAF domain-containing protein [Solirubrobacteraceae bacterium]